MIGVVQASPSAWNDETSTTVNVAGGATSGSYGTRPMLPTTAVSWPSLFKRWPRIDAVVDLPLVPVMSTTRLRSASVNQQLSALVTRTPRDRSDDTLSA